jgi:hypothetical protein
MLVPEGGKTIFGPLEGTPTHQIGFGHSVRIVDVTHVPVLPFHDVPLG